MGAHWSELTTEQLVAAIRLLGSAYESLATKIEQYTVNGTTLVRYWNDGDRECNIFQGIYHILVDLKVSDDFPPMFKVRLCEEIKRSENEHPKPDADEVQAAQQRARNRVAIATARAAATVAADLPTHNTTTSTNTAHANTSTAPASTTATATATGRTADLQQISKVVRDFLPLIETVYVSALLMSPALLDAETRLSNDPGDADAAATVSEFVTLLTRVMKHEVEHRLALPNITQTLRKVVKAGRDDFNDVYESVWDRCVKIEADGIARYKAAVAIALRDAETNAVEQTAGSIAELLQQASLVKHQFATVVNDIATACCGGVDPKTMPHGPQPHIPPTLKRTARIVEKLLLHPKGPTTSVSRIFDVVRGMIQCGSMVDVALVVEKLTACGAITIVRVKDRFTATPTAGGWRDCQICFFVNADPNHHVCELQVVHKNLYTNRKHLPGHLLYGRMRNAEEMLDVILNGCVGWFEAVGGPEHMLWQRCFFADIANTKVALQKMCLMALYKSMNGSKWHTDLQWSDRTAPLNKWAGVTVDKANNILGLSVWHTNAQGNTLTCQRAVANNTERVIIDSVECAVGKLVSELGQLISLQTLDLGYNGLEGKHTLFHLVPATY